MYLKKTIDDTKKLFKITELPKQLLVTETWYFCLTGALPVMVFGLSQLPFPSTILVQTLNFKTAGNPVHDIANYQWLSAKVLSAFRAKYRSFAFLFLYLKKSPVAIPTCGMPTRQSCWFKHYGFAESKIAKWKPNHKILQCFWYRIVALIIKSGEPSTSMSWKSVNLFRGKLKAMIFSIY